MIFRHALSPKLALIINHKPKSAPFKHPTVPCSRPETAKGGSTLGPLSAEHRLRQSLDSGQRNGLPKREGGDSRKHYLDEDTRACAFAAFFGPPSWSFGMLSCEGYRARHFGRLDV